MITVELFVDEINFLEETAKHLLTEDFEGWWITQDGFAELNISKASELQKKVLIRRLNGYNPKLVDGGLFINLNAILGV